MGVHRPIQLESNAKKLDVDQTLNLTWQVREIVKKYLKDMDVPDKYVDLIYSVAPNEVRWITQTEFDDDFQGLVPEVGGWAGAKCDQGNKEKIDVKPASLPASHASQSSEALQCWKRVKTQLSSEAWDKLFLNKQSRQ